MALIEPLLPPPACEPPKGDARPEKHPRREVVGAICYVVDSGCQWEGPTPRFPALADLLQLHGPLGAEITIVWPDSGYAGQLVTWAEKHLNLTLKTISRPNDAVGFVILPHRWVVERSLAWIMQTRRHARDYERLIQHSESLITWAAITLMTRRITRRSSRRSGQPASRAPVCAASTSTLSSTSCPTCPG